MMKLIKYTQEMAVLVMALTALSCSRDKPHATTGDARDASIVSSDTRFESRTDTDKFVDTTTTKGTDTINDTTNGRTVIERDTSSLSNSATDTVDTVDTGTKLTDDAGMPDAGTCRPGAMGCPCDVTLCDEGLECRDDVCQPPAICTPGLINSIADVCAEQLRICVESSGSSSCGNCVEGAREENGECVYPLLCGEIECDDTSYCDMSNPTAPVCASRPCTANQAITALGTCINCFRSCEVEGSTGRYWPFTDNEDNCICETRPDYFIPKGGDGNPIKCDADRDGWVRNDIQDPAFQADHATIDNMRCDVRQVDRVILEDEYGVDMTILSCDTGLIQNLSGTENCDVIVPLLLVESKRNDVPGEPELHTDTSPQYGSPNGRPLRANELNALTKGCATLLADYNDNGVEDIDDAQIIVDDPAAFTAAERLESFAYFIELHTSHYEAPSDGRYGVLRIIERSRCDADMFALGYDPATEYVESDDSTYWRNCYRRRDPGFALSTSMANSTVGYDFAQWSCEETSGACPSVAPASGTVDASNYTMNDPLLRHHGLCEIGDLMPIDGTWRGMHHHSQFKCVQVVASNAVEGSRDRNMADFSSGSLVFNECQAAVCDLSEDVLDCMEARGAEFKETRDPYIACTSDNSMAISGAVGFAALGYKDYTEQDSYQGGCVNEDVEWEYLCPFPEFGTGNVGQHGRYHCWCWEAMFLWASDEMTADNHNRSTLVWAADDASASNNSLWAPDVPDTSACVD